MAGTGVHNPNRKPRKAWEELVNITYATIPAKR
jgi:hypothetical protein